MVKAGRVGRLFLLVDVAVTATSSWNDPYFEDQPTLLRLLYTGVETTAVVGAGGLAAVAAGTRCAGGGPLLAGGCGLVGGLAGAWLADHATDWAFEEAG